MSDIEDEPPPVLLPCTVCSRTFRPEVLERHAKVCEKTAAKKRRVFDSFKSRVTGTELEEFLGPAPLPGQPLKRPVKSPVKKKAPSRWKETHENLIATLRAARGAEPPETMIEASKPAGNEQCPSCNRFFGPRAFDRHVEFCKEKTARLKLTPSKVSQAQERLEARTKYRAPLSIKPKLTTKEKYSPMLPRKESNENCTLSLSSTKSSPPLPALSKNTKPTKQYSSSFSRQNPSRSSERQRSVSPLKKSLPSSSKPSVKNEILAKSLNYSKVKENIKTPENMSPKAGTKASPQEKIRSCNIKLTQSEGETVKQLMAPKKKARERNIHKSNVPSDNESNGTVESEVSEKSFKHRKPPRSKWSSSENIKNVPKFFQEDKSISEKEKTSLGLESFSEKLRSKTKDDSKFPKKNKQQKEVINDLSVNDESFGIFVAACSTRPLSNSNKKTKISNEHSEISKSHVRKDKKNNTPLAETKLEVPENSNHKIRESSVIKPVILESVDTRNETFNIEKEIKHKVVEKASKIPKPKLDLNIKVVNKKEKEEEEYVEVSFDERANESILKEQMNKSIIEVTSEPKPLIENDVKKMSKKWHNISEISTEELALFSENFTLTGQGDEEMSSSAVWEIAGEQFLNSDEPDQSISIYSLDSLNETEEKKIASDVFIKKKNPNGDDFIVLHAPDPAKMLENDAEMKLSVSEPCFPFCDKMSKPGAKSPKNAKVDIVVFTAFPNALQPKITHRKRRKQRKLKHAAPKYSYIREKTFLTQDFPKAKRRRTTLKEVYSSQNFKDYYFGTFSKDFEERKKKFIEGLKNHREKIRKWQATANTQVQFMENFQKSIEDDLKELKKLFEEEKHSRESNFRDLRKEKLKKLVENRQKSKKSESTKKGKKFEYFEIHMGDENVITDVLERETPKLREDYILLASENNISKSPKKSKQKFECFEIATDDFVSKPKRGKSEEKKEDVEVREDQEKSEKENFNDNVKELRERLENHPEDENASKTTQIITALNGSLENIEEVDESVEEEKIEKSLNTFRKDIEIEDFIVVKPDTKKILSKEGNCLSQLFPKPRRISEFIKPVESKTAVALDYAADSVYDLKSNSHKTSNKLPEISGRKCSKTLEKRIAKLSHLPQISVKTSIEKKENSMISLIEMWKHKRENAENDKLYKTKATLPTGKLAPLSNKNTFQIAVLPSILKKELWEILKGILSEGDSDDSYDPFKQAERQMIALLSWPSTADIKTTKDLSATPKSNSQQKPNLESSPTSAFTKYPNKNNETKNEKTSNARRNLNDTFEINNTAKNEKPTYTRADDWEQIFEQHFDLNKNEMTEQMTRTVKSALDGLLKNTIKNKTNKSENVSLQKNKTNTPENSIITDILYTSTPKQNSKSERSFKTRSKDSTIGLDETPNTYRKNSNFTYDKILPTQDLHDSSEKRKKEDKTNRNSGISLSSLSFCSQISDTTLADEEVMQSNLEIIGKAAAARTPRRKYIRSQSVFDERNKMLFAKTYDPNYSSSDENDVEIVPKLNDKQGNKSPSRNPYPKSFPSHFYRSQSVVEDRYKGDGDHTDDGDQISSPESNRNRKGKLSGDSAYSSLNRRSPRESKQKNEPEDRLSSSGSDHSLPTDQYELKPKSLDFGNSSQQKKDQPVKMSKFCHECGSKYPVAVAKFCCECGVRRLII